MRSTLFAVLVVAAGPALADCPTGDAMRAGEPAYVIYPDGGLVELKRLGEGVVQETTRYEDGTGEFRMVSMGGVFIIDEVDMDGDVEVDHSRVRSIYPGTEDLHLPLRPRQTFSVAALNTFADGSEPEEEYIEVRTGDLAEIDIAGCHYEGFPVLLTYHWSSEDFTSMMTHLPDLGVSLELARMDHGQDPLPFAPRYFDLDHP